MEYLWRIGFLFLSPEGYQGDFNQVVMAFNGVLGSELAFLVVTVNCAEIVHASLQEHFRGDAESPMSVIIS